MLSISPIGSASYYLELAREDYFIEGGEPPGKWAGEGAEAYGLESGKTVWKEHLRSILAGCDPHNPEESLVQVQGEKRRQGGWDLTFSAPKSVSVLWSQADPKTRAVIQHAQDRAVRAALDYVEKNALVMRTGQGGANREFATGGFFALFEHGTSRAHDPQLHTHALASNLCVGRDGKTRTVWSHDFYLHKMAAGAIYRAELAYGLEQDLDIGTYRPTVAVEEMGVKTNKPLSWFEVEGVSEKACEHFSKRAQQIEELAEQHGWSSPKVKAYFAKVSREFKGHVNREESFALWTELGQKYGFGRQEADQLIYGTKERKELSTEEIAERTKTVIETAKERLNEKTAYFRERDLTQYIAEECQGRGLGAEGIETLVASAKGELVELPDPDSLRPYYATREMMELEEDLLSQAETLANTDRHTVAPEHIEAAISEVNKELKKEHGGDAELSQEQIRALYHIVENPSALTLVQGLAGTGKTSLLKAARLAWEKSGYQVLGLAVSGKAAVNLLSESGIESRSLYKTLRLLERTGATKVWDAVKGVAKTAQANASNSVKYPGASPVKFPRQQAKAPESLKIGPKSIVVADEASMINSKDWNALQAQVVKSGAKLVPIGDRNQVQSIGAGGPFSSLLDRHEHASLTDIKRQKHEWMRDALKAFVADDADYAIGLYAENDAFRVSEDKEQAIETLVRGWLLNRTSDLTKTIALTSTNEEARSINEKIQRLRSVFGEVDFGGVKNKAGQTLRGRDRVLLTQNNAALGVFNGDLGTIVDIQRPRGIAGPASITVQLDRTQDVGLFPKGLIGLGSEPTVPLFEKKRKVTIDLKDYQGVELGYALTTAKAQGGSFDVGHVLGSDVMQDRQQTYTQLSRIKDQIKVYLTEQEAGENLADFVATASKSREKKLANDVKLTDRQRYEREHREQAEKQHAAAKLRSDVDRRQGIRR